MSETEEPETDPRIFEALDGFVEALLAGEPVDVETWMKRHPDLGDALREELELVASLHQTAASVAMDAAEPAGESEPEVPAGRRFLAPGEQLGDHVIEELLGYGGMGEVYRAHHRHLEKTVAIKVLRPLLADDPAAVRRFRDEVKAQASLRPHRNVVTAMHASEHDGRLYLVMEHVAGSDLARLVRSEGPLSATEAADYLRQAAEGLAHAHHAGLVHRDVKPSNLLVDDEGVLRIVDLGLARLAIRDDDGDGRKSFIDELVGSLDYVSPEQAGDPSAADARSDLYGLGCTLYYMLTGRAPFADRLMLKKLMAHATLDPAPIDRDDVPDGLLAILERLMQKDPDARFESADDLVDAIDELDLAAPRTTRAIRDASRASKSGDPEPAPPTAAEKDEPIDWRTGAIIALVIGVLTLLGLYVAERQQQQPSEGAEGDAGAALVAPPVTPAFGVGAAREDELTDDDDRRPKEGSAFHRVPFQAAPDTTYVLTLRSADFDPVLVLRDEGGFELMTSHDAPGLGRSAEVVIDASPEARTYDVLVTSERDTGRGNYLLSARVEGDPLLVADAPTEGFLREGEDALYYEDDTLYDSYALRVTAGETYVVVMSAEGFGPAVFVENDDGRRLTQSQSTDVVGEARTVYDATSDGLVHVIANTASESSGGPYTLSVTTELSGEERVHATGLLAEGDETARDGSFYDAYPLEVTGGNTYVATMRSEDFDTYLLLVDPATDERIAANDDAFGTDSRLVWTAPRDGAYAVWANSYRAGETGQYQIEIRELAQ